jgi:CheY-like chemotaxis protein/two-component sensor histidine kinase
MLLSNIYNTEITIDIFLKLIISNYECEKAILCWKNKLWYILPDFTLMNLEPDIIRITKKYNFNISNYKEILLGGTEIISKIGYKYKLFLCNVKSEITINDNDAFILTSYIDKLYHKFLLDKQKKEQEIMLSNISHSIRNPLNNILQLVPSDGELKMSALALSNSIIDIIDLTKLKMGKLQLNITRFSLTDCIQNILFIINDINKNDIPINVVVADSIQDIIYTDEIRLKQIIINILENSINYTYEGAIDIYVSSVNNLINIIISDTGIGMNKNILDETYTNIDGISIRLSSYLAELLGGKLKLNYTNSKGTSFELSILSECNSIKNIDKNILVIGENKDVIKLLNFHNISFLYTSKENQKYYEDFDLIIVNVETDISQMKYKYSIAINNNTKCDESMNKLSYDKLISIMTNPNLYYSVLIVEDDIIGRKLLVKTIKELNFKYVENAKNGFDAIELIKSYFYDVMLIDIRMPNMSGFELAEFIRDYYKEKKCPKLIAITGQIIEEQNGVFDEYLYKPINIYELNSKIKYVLNGKSDFFM